MESLVCERMESTVGGMESMHSVALYGIKTEGRGIHGKPRCHTPVGNSMQFAKRIDAIHKPFGLE